MAMVVKMGLIQAGEVSMPVEVASAMAAAASGRGVAVATIAAGMLLAAAVAMVSCRRRELGEQVAVMVLTAEVLATILSAVADSIRRGSPVARLVRDPAIRMLTGEV
jgi:hypothetical protein